MNVRELAKLAGVSASTVSRVFRGIGNVSPDVAENVRRIAEEHGYTPRRPRRGRPLQANLRRVLTGRVLLLVSGSRGAQAPWTNPLIRVLMRQGQRILHDHGYAVFFDEHDPAGGQPVSAQGADGVIGVLFGQVPKGLELVPGVWILPELGLRAGDLLDVDDEAAGFLAAEGLHAAGCRTCAVVQRDRSPGLHRFSDRVDAFIHTAGQLGLQVEAMEGEGASAAGWVRRFIDLPSKPQGLFVAGGDVEVATAADALEATGRQSWGRDVFLAGCMADHAGHALCGGEAAKVIVDLGLAGIAEAAVETMVWRLWNPKAPLRRIHIGPRLVSQGAV